nr:MAG TPA: chromosome partitioning protein [Caudoviricetes sp.]
MEAVSNSDTPRITMIPITELRPNGGNFYDTSNFEDLADSIELNGLLEPLCVFRRGQGTGSYVIFSGHRRFKALRLLYEKSGFEKWTEVPCIVFPDPHDANRETVMLIHANSTGRVLSNWEKTVQALRLKKALVAMREGGAELPGRIRDLVAAEMQMSASKLARLEAIGNNLTYRSWFDLWKAGKLNESVAYRLSMLEWEEQERVWLWLSENRPGLSAEKLALKDVEAAINPEPEEDETEDVSNSDTGDALSGSGGAADVSPGGTDESERVSNLDTWRRCLVDEPEEGQLVLVVEPDIPSMPDVCVYRDGQFVDGIGHGDAMEVKSFWLWLPLPPFPWEVSEE